MITKKEAWQNLAVKIDAKPIEMSFVKGSIRLEKQHKLWTIYLDTYTVYTGKGSMTFTRMRAPYAGMFDFRMKIGRTNIFTKIAKYFGKQYATSGDYGFDDKFYIKCFDESLVKKVFENSQLKDALRGIKKVSILIKKAGGKEIFDEYMLNYTLLGVIKDIERLEKMFEVLMMLLDEFEKNGIAKAEKPMVVLYK